MANLKTELGKIRKRKRSCSLREESIGSNFEPTNSLIQVVLGPVVSLFSGEGKRKRSEISVTSENKPVMDWTDNDTGLLKNTLLRFAETDLRWAHDGRHWSETFWSTIARDFNSEVLKCNWNRQNTGLNGHTRDQIAIKACEFEADFVSARESHGYNTLNEPLFSDSASYLRKKTTSSQTQSMSSGVRKRSRSDYLSGASSRDNNGDTVAKFLNTARDEYLISKDQYHALMKNKNFLKGSWPGMIEDEEYSKQYVVNRMLEALDLE